MPNIYRLEFSESALQQLRIRQLSTDDVTDAVTTAYRQEGLGRGRYLCEGKTKSGVILVADVYCPPDSNVGYLLSARRKGE